MCGRRDGRTDPRTCLFFHAFAHSASVSLSLLGVASPVATDSVGGEPSLLPVVYGVDGQSRYWAGALLRTFRAIERCFGSVSRTVHCGYSQSGHYGICG